MEGVFFVEYNRLIAYIYSYNRGMKSRNTGFAKIENRQNVLKMQINMKDAYTDNAGMWTVYLFYRHNGRIIGINVGKMRLANGTGEFRYCGNSADIENSGISFGMIKGLYIALNDDNNKIFASEWDDLGFSIDKISGMKQEPGIKIEFENEEEREHSDGFTIIEEKRSDDEACETTPEKTPEKTVLEVAEVKEDKTDEPDVDDLMRERSKFDAIMQGRDKKYIFADDDLYDVVEITPDDIDRMPDTNWGLRNNSFINHGYFNFRHLIMGKIYGSDKCGYFIGVPGVYTRRDRNTAAMFGFNRFKFSMRGDMNLGQFGYWYRELNC